MCILDFEWDTNKASSNLQKHGVSFEDAKEAFQDVFAINLADDFEDEYRSALLGSSDGSILFVVYTERPPAVRIISARKANKNEQNRYYYENFSAWSPD